MSNQVSHGDLFKGNTGYMDAIERRARKDDRRMTLGKTIILIRKERANLKKRGQLYLRLERLLKRELEAQG